LTSAIAYTFWYAALPSLSAWRAALVQLAVPLLTALGAVAILDETVTGRLAISGALIAGGVLVSVLGATGRSADR
jgi:drug/metabolite transporter (DMT)-like permease